MRKLFLLLIFLPSVANAQIYGAPGGIYPICQDVTTCSGGQCQTVRVCR
jgi:hypothetical protein